MTTRDPTSEPNRAAADAAPAPPAAGRDRARARVRVVLGIAQLVGAGLSAGLLAARGADAASGAAVGATVLLAAVSRVALGVGRRTPHGRPGTP